MSQDVALKKLIKAKRIARTIPGADIHDDLDALFNTVYRWTESGGRHVKLYECGLQQYAMQFSKILKEWFAVERILGSTQLYSEGRIFVDFWGPASSQAGRQIDEIHADLMKQERGYERNY